MLKYRFDWESLVINMYNGIVNEFVMGILLEIIHIFYN